MLHQQLISEMTLYDRLDNDGWHALLSLLAKSPEDARAIGGVAKTWELGAGTKLGGNEPK